MSWKSTRHRNPPRSDGTKTCTRCQEELPRVEFGPSVNTIDGRLNYCRACDNHQRTLAKHGLTRQQKATRAQQQGGCLICRRTAPGGQGWCVDHDRRCCPGDKSCAKCRRGILCTWCNSALGYAGDSPELLRKMADYLDRWNATRESE